MTNEEPKCPFDVEPEDWKPDESSDDPFALLDRPMSRRQFLKAAAAAWFSLMIPVRLFRSVAQAAGPLPALPGHWDRTLILLELNGGNDGLNTVIPYTDPLYYDYRKRVAVERDQIAKLTDRIGLHPSLAGLVPMWQSKNMAIIQGVGYPKPNRSHFRSIAIWETAADSDQYLDDGWIARLFAESPPPEGAIADGIVIGNGQAGPLGGERMRVVNMERPEQFLNESKNFAEPALPGSSNPALEHILDVERDIRQAASALGQRLRQGPVLKTPFPKSRIGNHLNIAARLIASGTPVPVLKLSHGSFDTHSGQAGRHVKLLQELSEGLVAFEAAMKEIGRWDNVLLMTYSEFGRRVKDNDSAGTDHGTAAPHFLMGGRVHGGLFGPTPSLTDLDEGDLKHHIDYRSLYETVAARWWDVKTDFLPKRQRYDIIKCLR